MRILIDTNVLLDFLLGRQPYFQLADEIIKLCAGKKLQGYMAVHSIPNMFYILRKEMSEEERREILLSLCAILMVENIDAEKIISALNDRDFRDMEDCLQSQCAERINAEYIITRNVKDFTTSKVPAILPGQFLKMYED